VRNHVDFAIRCSIEENLSSGARIGRRAAARRKKTSSGTPIGHSIIIKYAFRLRSSYVELL
jgi:hypothetical protein